jgi:hypothetical protein
LLRDLLRDADGKDLIEDWQAQLTTIFTSHSSPQPNTWSPIRHQIYKETWNDALSKEMLVTELLGAEFTPRPKSPCPILRPKHRGLAYLTTLKKILNLWKAKGHFIKCVRCHKSAVLVYLIKSTCTSKISNT